MADFTLVLMGLRGSGKSTVGRAAAERWGVGFVDLDDRTLARLRGAHGVNTIAEAFTVLGEPVFRRAECAALEDVLGEGGVIALGGGTPMAPGASELLRTSGALLVYLHLDPEALRERIRAEIDHRRPALRSGGDAVGEIKEVYAERDPLYRLLAQAILEADQPVGVMIDRLETLLGSA